MERDSLAERTPLAWQAAHQVISTAFALCSLPRTLPKPSRYYWKQALLTRGITLTARLSFWLRLLQAAHLLAGSRCAPTLLAKAWFALPPHIQLRDLLNAWVAMPQTVRVRQRRTRLLEKLADPNRTLSTWEQQEVHSLQALALWREDHLTDLGRCLLQGAANPPIPFPSMPLQPWQQSGYTLFAWRQQDFHLLWQLEGFLAPYAPNRYLLTSSALRQASQRGSMDEFISILERGLEHPLPPEEAARIRSTPSIRLLTGCVLEFDDPADLAALRQVSPSLRRRLDPLLSPRHVYMPPNTQPDTLQALQRRGIPISMPISSEEVENDPRTGLNTGELADLYALALVAQETGIGISLSAELVTKLSQRLPLALRRAARHAAQKALDKIRPSPSFSPAEEPGSSIPPDRLDAIQCAIDQGEMIYVSYQKPRQAVPERRRLTPLLIEQRGLYLYLIAYCHERRANRTFQLDRLTIDLL